MHPVLDKATIYNVYPKQVTKCKWEKVVHIALHKTQTIDELQFSATKGKK